MEEFLTRFGDIATGVFFLVASIVILVLIIIEVIDFLIVDPLRRNTENDVEKEAS